VRGSAAVVEEHDGGIFFAMVGGSNPIPGAAAGGGKTETGSELLVVRRFVEGFEIEGLETIDGPASWPEAFLAGRVDLEAGGLDGGFVFVQFQEPFGEEFAQFLFDVVRLGIQKALQVGFVDYFELLGGWPGANAFQCLADSDDDDKEYCGHSERAEYKDWKLVHVLMILHSEWPGLQPVAQ
jgi:hypothetical protein